MKKLFGLVAIFLATALVLAACGSGSGSGDNAKIAIGPPASATNAISTEILKAYGIEEGDYEKYQEGFGDAADLLQDGNIDISIGILGLPASSISNLQAAAGDVKMISLTDDAVKYIEENTGYRQHTIPADSYDFLEEDVQTVTAYAILMGNTNTISEELGYQLAKTMVEKSSEITHQQGKQMIIENALKGSEGLPIHPGAKRYYEEQGVEVPNPVAELNVDEQKTELILGTGSSGGTYYPLGGEMAGLWNNYIDGINVTSTETGASLENLASIRDGKMDLGMSVHVPALTAVNGEGDFKDATVENAAFIGHIYPEVVQIVTRESTGIEGLEDLAK